MGIQRVTIQFWRRPRRFQATVRYSRLNVRVAACTLACRVLLLHIGTVRKFAASYVAHLVAILVLVMGIQMQAMPMASEVGQIGAEAGGLNDCNSCAQQDMSAGQCVIVCPALSAVAHSESFPTEVIRAAWTWTVAAHASSSVAPDAGPPRA